MTAQKEKEKKKKNRILQKLSLIACGLNKNAILNKIIILLINKWIIEPYTGFAQLNKLTKK